MCGFAGQIAFSGIDPAAMAPRLARALEALFGDEGTRADGDADGEVLRGGVVY